MEDIWSLHKELESINCVIDMACNEKYFFVRKSRGITLLDKNSLETRFDIPIEIDNELGSHPFILFEDTCITVVYDTPTSKDGSGRGDPKKASITAFDSTGKIWSHALQGWSITANFGGLHGLGPAVIFNDKVDGEMQITVLDAKTGQVKLVEPSRVYKNTTQTKVGKELALSFGSTALFALEGEGFVQIKLSDQGLETKTVIQGNPASLAQIDDHVFFHLRNNSESKISAFNKKTGQFEKEIILEKGIILEKMIPSKNGESITLIDEKQGILHSLDVKSACLKWKKDCKPPSSPFQTFNLQVDDCHYVYTLLSEPRPVLQILDPETGNCLQEIRGQKSSLEMHFAVLGDKLFLQDFASLYCYLLADASKKGVKK